MKARYNELRTKKIKVVTVLIKRHALKTYGEAEITLKVFLPLSLDVDELHTPTALSPGNEPSVPIGQVTQSRSGRGAEESNLCPD